MSSWHWLEYPEGSNVPFIAPLDWEFCQVCERRREKLYLGDSCEDCSANCDVCGDLVNPDLLKEVDNVFECEVCCDAREGEAAWIEENL